MAPPSLAFLLGTDQLGRDVFSRVVMGGRVALHVAFVSLGASLSFGLVARPAGEDKAEAGLALLDAMTSAGMPMKTVLADRGYTYLKAASWAGPLQDREIEQVLDLHKNQRAVRPGPKPGTIWVDGGLFTSALPKHLRSLPWVGPKTPAAEKARLTELYSEREAYAFKQMAAPDYARRTVRLRGPARAGRLRCPNYPESMRRNPGIRPTTSCKPGGCACGDTITAGPDDMLRERQKAPFGTRAWNESYGRRSAIESLPGVGIVRLRITLRRAAHSGERSSWRRCSLRAPPRGIPAGTRVLNDQLRDCRLPRDGGR